MVDAKSSGSLSRQISLIAVFAALDAILGMLPFTITVGVSGQITMGAIGGPLTGLILGPLNGGVAVAIGSLIGILLNPGGALFGALSVLPPTLGALGAGMIRDRKGYVPGLAIALSVLMFYLHPEGRAAFMYPWLHVIAMIFSISSLSKISASSIGSEDLRQLSLGAVSAIFVGTLTDHAFGSGLAIWYFSLPAAIWGFVTFVYPLERGAITVIASVIAIPVYHRLRSAGLIEIVGKS